MKYNYYDYEYDIEHNWDVDYTIQPGEKGNRAGDHDTWTPDWGPEMTQMDVFDEYGKNITDTLPSRVLDTIEELCWKDAHDHAYDY